MKNLYSFLAIFFTLFFIGCQNNDFKSPDTNNNIDTTKLSTAEKTKLVKEKIDETAEQIKTNADKYTKIEFKNECKNENIKATLKKFTNAKDTNYLFVYSSENEKYYEYCEYYFENNKIILAYFYSEEYENQINYLSEYYFYCATEKVFAIYGKKSEGDDKILDGFDDIPFEEYEIDPKDTPNINEAIKFFDEVTKEEDLQKWICPTE